jgi:D-alanyl-D-alanine carboxypeptidase (penicillin-binding protein 5/6)
MNIKLVYCFFCFLIFKSVYSEQLKIGIEGESGILMNAETGTILFEKEVHQLFYPASTTKIATGLYALKSKKLQLNDVLVADAEDLATVTAEAKKKSNYKLPAYWQETDGVHIGIQRGETFSFHDLLKGLLICSANDAANVIARSVGGTIPQFMDDLNQFLKEIGCKQTHFCNPHGLHHPEHYTTAYDLAIMAKEALKNPLFCEIVSQTRFIRPQTNKQKEIILPQRNRLLRPGKYYYSKAFGIKTGYHSKSKHTFVAAARSGERTLIAVLLGYRNRNQLFEDTIKLFDSAFNQPKIKKTFLKKGPQKFNRAVLYADRVLETNLSEDLNLECYPAEEIPVKCLLYWDSLHLPIQAGQRVGELSLVSSQGEKMKSVPLFAIHELNLRWPYSWMAVIRHYSFSLLFVVGILSILILYLFITWFLDPKRSK